MKHIFKIVFGIICFTTFSVQADLYTVTNVEMSGVGNNPVEAKNNAITSGELRAFDQIMLTLVGENNQALIERPTDDEILSMVRDISITSEKNTNTAYWGKMNVRFKEPSIQNLLKKNNQVYLKKAPPVYWVIPIFRQGTSIKTLEDENSFYQMLKGLNRLSDTFQMILPNGDVNELIATEHALTQNDFSEMEKIAHQNGAERILVIEVSMDPFEKWEMKPLAYYGTENNFTGISVQGTNVNTFVQGWQQLNQKMAQKWQDQYRSDLVGKNTYYARYHISQVSGWHQLEKELKHFGFLENLNLQGAMPGQLLFSFDYANSFDELQKQLNRVGFSWELDSAFVGTLKRKDFYENTL